MINEQTSYSEDSELKLLGVLSIVVVTALAISIIFGIRAQRKPPSVPTETASYPFFQVNLQAKAAYVYDIRTGEILFARNADTRLPLASLTKIMAALVALERGLEHNTITISSEALQAEGDSGLLRDEKWFLRDLLNFSLVTSSNDGIRAAALALGALSSANASTDEIINDFVGAMNNKAGELGLKNTYFWNETGLDESEIKGGAYGTARDTSALMAHIFGNYPTLFSATRESEVRLKSLDNRIHNATNTNSIVSDIPGLLASKTGFTDTAGGNLSIIFDPELGRPIVITVLGSTEQSRFDDVRTLIFATLEYLSKK